MLKATSASSGGPAVPGMTFRITDAIDFAYSSPKLTVTLDEVDEGGLQDPAKSGAP